MTIQDTRPDSAVDPVCGMTVTIRDAEAAGLSFEYAGETYYFCARGCLLDFRDDPARALDPSFHPDM